VSRFTRRLNQTPQDDLRPRAQIELRDHPIPKLEQLDTESVLSIPPATNEVVPLEDFQQSVCRAPMQGQLRRQLRRPEIGIGVRKQVEYAQRTIQYLHAVRAIVDVSCRRLTCDAH